VADVCGVPFGSAQCGWFFLPQMSAADCRQNGIFHVGAAMSLFTYAHLDDVTIPAMVGRAFLSGAMGS
jgi:hypothetical protein